MLTAPFPWFGGKRRVAKMVWSRFGDVPNYNEPFAGSLAVLLGRPTEPRVETVNDLDNYLANFWRALQADPEQVAWWADWPVNEADLHARHRWLVDRHEFGKRMAEDPEYYDCQIAGWWVWGQCLWIGSGWCQRPEWSGRANAGRYARGINAASVQFDRNANGTAHQARRPHITKDQGVIAKRPARSGNGHAGGVHRRWQGGGQGGGSGVHAPSLWKQMPDLSGDAGAVGRGVHRGGLAGEVTSEHAKRPYLGGGATDGYTRAVSGRGLLSEAVRTEGLYQYMAELSHRLRRVRVCCGDWRRVLTPSVTTYIGVTGVFLDPPYSHELRERCYSEDHDISSDVHAWALEHGDNPKFRIALCGYEGEHEMPATWECVPWKAHGGYSRSERGKKNRTRERIWFSPHCLRRSDQFDFEGANEADTPDLEEEADLEVDADVPPAATGEA